MNAGREFVKKIGPLGSILFLLAFIFFLVLCFLPPKDKEPSDEQREPEGYSWQLGPQDVSLFDFGGVYTK